MMNPALRWWLGVNSAVAATVALALLLTGPGSRRTWDAYDAVAEGMTEAEVAATLGGPPGASNVGPAEFCIVMPADEFGAFDRLNTREWVNDDALIWVEFDADGRVVRKFCTANRCGCSSWLRVLCYRLGF